MEVENNPNDPAAGTRPVSFSKHLYIEQEDFWRLPCPNISACILPVRVPPEGRLFDQVHRLRQGRGGQCGRGPGGYDPDSRGGNPADGRKVKGPPSTGWTPPLP